MNNDPIEVHTEHCDYCGRRTSLYKERIEGKYKAILCVFCEEENPTFGVEVWVKRNVEYTKTINLPLFWKGFFMVDISFRGKIDSIKIYNGDFLIARNGKGEITTSPVLVKTTSKNPNQDKPKYRRMNR